MEAFRSGQFSELVRFATHPGEPAVVRSSEGSVLLRAEALPSGGVLITDEYGNPTALYSAEEVRRLLEPGPRHEEMVSFQ